MKTTRKALGALAVALMGAGVAASCAPTPAPPAPSGPSDTKNVSLDCTLDIYSGGNFLFSSTSTYATTISLSSTDVAAGADATIEADITGIINGPLAQASGTANFDYTVDGNAASTPDVALGAAAANGPVTVPTVTDTVGPINGDTVVQLTQFNFVGQGANAGDFAEGTCALPGGGQPTITIGNV